MHTRARSPSNREKNQSTQASDYFRRGSLLWLQFTVFVELQLLKFMQALEEGWDDDEGADESTVLYNVESHAPNDGIESYERERADEHHRKDVFARRILAFDLRLAF